MKQHLHLNVMQLCLCALTAHSPNTQTSMHMCVWVTVYLDEPSTEVETVSLPILHRNHQIARCLSCGVSCMIGLLRCFIHLLLLHLQPFFFRLQPNKQVTRLSVP